MRYDKELLSHSSLCHNVFGALLNEEKFHLSDRVRYMAINDAYYFTKSKTRIARWLIQEGNPHDPDNFGLCGKRIGIVCVSAASKLRQTVYVNSTIRLRTLLMLLNDIIRNPSGKETMVLRNESDRMKAVVMKTTSGHKTLKRIGFENNDALHIFSNVEENNAARPSQKTTNMKSNKKTKKKTKRPPKKRSSKSTAVYCSNANGDRLNHSKLLSLVFEEAASIFQERRRVLNDLAIKKSQPKPRDAKAQLSRPSPMSHPCFNEPEVKPGKSIYPVLVGEEMYLYRTSKSTKHHLQRKPHSLDLHGCTKDEAILRLNDALPTWMGVAMKEFPWTIPVNIITGCGNQVLSEQWITGFGRVGMLPIGLECEARC